MAKSAGGTFVKRIQDAFAKIGTNGTKMPDGACPKDVKGNDAISRWHDCHNAVSEFLVAKTLKSAAEAREKRAKADLMHVMQIDVNKLVIGNHYLHVFDNVALDVNPRNPQRRIDRAKLLSALAVNGITGEKAEAIITASESEGEPPLYLTPTTTVT